MISRKLTIGLAAALIALHTVGARADDEAAATATTPGSGPTAYVSAGGVFAVENNKSALESGVSEYGGLSNSGGYDLRVGYDFAKMCAAELEWQSLTSFSTDGVDPFTSSNLPSVEQRMMSLNGLFIPLSGRIRPYALVGAGWVNAQADRQAFTLHTSSFGMRFGLGVAAMITKRIGFALEAAYILPLTGTMGGGDRFDTIPITGSFFFRFK